MEDLEKRPWWSVRVSGVVKLLLIVFGGLCLIAFVVAGVGFISASWITPPEKHAAIRALGSIETVRAMHAADDRTYEEQVNHATEEIQKAQKVAFTSRDKSIAVSLDGYLILLKSRRETQKTNRLLKERGYERLENSSPVSEEMDDQVEHFVGMSLHRWLGIQDSGK